MFGLCGICQSQSVMPLEQYSKQYVSPEKPLDSMSQISESLHEAPMNIRKKGKSGRRGKSGSHDDGSGRIVTGKLPPIFSKSESSKNNVSNRSVIAVEDALLDLSAEVNLLVASNITATNFDPTYLVDYCVVSAPTRDDVADSPEWIEKISDNVDARAKKMAHILRRTMEKREIKFSNGEAYCLALAECLQDLNALVVQLPRKTYPESSLTSEEVLVIVDVFLIAILNFLVDREGLTNLTITSSFQLDYQIDALLSQIYRFGGHYSVQSREKLLWCQVMARTCLMTQSLLVRLKDRQFSDTMVSIKLSSLSSWLHSISNALVETKYLHADFHHVIYAFYWNACSTLIKVFKSTSYPRIVQRLYEDCVMDEKGTLSKIEFNAKMSKLKTEMSSLIGKIVHVLTVTSPTPAELASEVNKYLNSPVFSYVDNTQMNSMSIISLKSPIFATAPLSAQLPLTKSTVIATSRQPMSGNWTSSKLRWIIVGVSALLDGGEMSVDDPRAMLAQRAEWIWAINESLTYLFNFSPFASQPFYGDRQFLPSTSSVTSLSSFMLAILMRLFFANDDMTNFNSVLMALNQV